MTTVNPQLPAHPGAARPVRLPVPSGHVLAVIAAVALGAVCVVHLIDGPGSLGDRFYVGALELALAAAALPLAILLLIRPLAPLWSAALALNLLALAAYLASRTVGLPGSTDDIGNWGQQLGIISMLAEVTVIAVAARALAGVRGAAAGSLGDV